MIGPSSVFELHNYYKTRGRACQETKAPVEQWAMKPILNFKRHAASRAREDHEKWTKEAINGHQLEILGERHEGSAREQHAFDDTAERLRCKKCERTWPWVFRATIKHQRKCTGNPAERRTLLQRETAKLKEWLKANKTAHKLEYSAIMGKWHCSQCRQSGGTVWNVNRDHVGYNKRFLQIAATACERHADQEGIT